MKLSEIRRVHKANTVSCRRGVDRYTRTPCDSKEIVYDMRVVRRNVQNGFYHVQNFAWFLEKCLGFFPPPVVVDPAKQYVGFQCLLFTQGTRLLLKTLLLFGAQGFTIILISGTLLEVHFYCGTPALFQHYGNNATLRKWIVYQTMTTILNNIY